MESFTIKKIANALIAGAEPVDHPIMNLTGFTVTGCRKIYGGLWVGGVVELTRHSISFTPNALNMKLHKNLEAVEIQSSEIESIQRRFGWFTGIVEIKHKRGEFKFRCYGAKKIVEQYLAYQNQP